MAPENVTNMVSDINQYGVGMVAVAIVFVMVIVLFGILVKLVYDNNANHRKEMVPVLKALTESLDTLSETQMALKEQLVDKLGSVARQAEATHVLIETHVRDCSRMENTINILQPSILKTEERTKVCVERTRKDPHL